MMHLHPHVCCFCMIFVERSCLFCFTTHPPRQPPTPPPTLPPTSGLVLKTYYTCSKIRLIPKTSCIDLVSKLICLVNFKGVWAVSSSDSGQKRYFQFLYVVWSRNYVSKDALGLELLYFTPAELSKAGNPDCSYFHFFATRWDLQKLQNVIKKKRHPQSPTKTANIDLSNKKKPNPRNPRNLKQSKKLQVATKIGSCNRAHGRMFDEM